MLSTSINVTPIAWACSMNLKSIVAKTLVSILESNGRKYVAMPRGRPRTCAICNFTGTFKPYGAYYIRSDAKCPSCGSLERHRLLKIAFDTGQIPHDGKDWLHFAPENAVRRFVEPYAKTYVTADLFEDGMDHAWNIEDIDCESERFDMILCSHVLEHVKTEIALSEMFRILRPGGVAVLMVPICEGLETTYVNADIKTERDRWAHFQQSDHDRILGRDFRDMVRDAGFSLNEIVAEGEQAVINGLVMGERVFLARKEV